MSKHPSALLALLSHAVAGCQALRLGAPVHAGSAGNLSAAAPGEEPLVLPYGRFLAVKGCLTRWRVSGRFGNQLAGFADAVFMAERCGIPCVHVPAWYNVQLEPFFDLPEFVPVDSVDSADNTSALCEQAVEHFKSGPPGSADFPPMDWTKKIFAKYLFSKLKPPSMDGLYRDDTLVIHLRGKDVLQGRPNDASYFPAPCSFYRHVMQQGWQGKPFSRVIAIADSDEHPCLSILDLKLQEQKLVRLVASDEKKGIIISHRAKQTSFSDFETQSHDTVLQRLAPAQDFMFLVSAKNVACSVSSTFSFGGFMMNPNGIVNVFMPTWKGRETEHEAGFKQSRLEELCHIGEQSNIYELPFPTGYDKLHTYNPRKGFLEDNQFSIDASTDIHRCNESNLHSGK